MCSWQYIPSSRGGGSRGPNRSSTQFSTQNSFNMQRQRNISSRPQPLLQRGYRRGQWPVDLESPSMRPGTPILPGYIPPGTHTIPSLATSRRRQHPPGFLPRLRSQHPGYFSDHHTPLFSDCDDEFFPPDTLPPIYDIDENAFMDFGIGRGGGGGAVNSGVGTGAYIDGFDDDRSREKFGERLASFPEVPLDAHRRIFHMGNEIVDCFDVRLERFYRGSLLDNIQRCVAVFTKKERTGQRWLMVFKEEISRTVVKFNRLLTHSLMVSVVSQTAIEIEAAKAMYGPPAEMCVINFRNEEDCSRFYRTLQESQTTAWNHREVTQEQRMKTLVSKITAAIAQNDYLFNSTTCQGRPRPMTPPAIPISRSPFTLRDRGDPCGLLRTPNPTPRPNSVAAVACLSADNLADLDDDWRRRAYDSGNDSDGTTPFIPLPVIPPHSRKSRSENRLASNASISLASAIASMAIGPTGNKFDGSGDQDIPSPCEEVEPLPEEIQVEILDITLFVKVDSEFEKIGKGTLQLVDHKDAAFSELRLMSSDQKELVHQFIFKWNSVHKVSTSAINGNGEKKNIEENETESSSACVWDGAASFDKTPDAVPERRQFMVHVQDELADQFVTNFNKAAEKARNPAVRRRHISWYLQQKREYKDTTSTSPTKDKANTREV